MSRRNINIISTFFALVVVIFIGVFAAVLSGNSIDPEKKKQEKFHYERLAGLYKNENYIDLEQAIKELNSKFPDSDYTKKANNEFKNIKELAEKQRLEKSAQDADLEAKQQKTKKEYEEANEKARASKQQQFDELWDSYNTVLSRNNYEPFYAGIEIKNKRITILVKDSWNFVSKDVQKAFVENSVKLWGGMHGARKMSFSYDDWNFEYKHDLSGRVVATWGSIRGTSIKD